MNRSSDSPVFHKTIFDRVLVIVETPYFQRMHSVYHELRLNTAKIVQHRHFICRSQQMLICQLTNFYFFYGHQLFSYYCGNSLCRLLPIWFYVNCLIIGSVFRQVTAKAAPLRWMSVQMQRYSPSREVFAMP